MEAQTNKPIHQQRVDEFMKLAKQVLPDKPIVPSREVILLRARLIMEEVLETMEAMGVEISCTEVGMGINGFDVCKIDRKELRFRKINPTNIVETIDGLADISVVTYGTASAFGVALGPVLEEVDYNNLAKFGPGHSIREDGKLIKPPGHKRPDFEKVLIEQGWVPPKDDNNASQRAEG